MEPIEFFNNIQIIMQFIVVSPICSDIFLQHIASIYVEEKIDVIILMENLYNLNNRLPIYLLQVLGVDGKAQYFGNLGVEQIMILAQGLDPFTRSTLYNTINSIDDLYYVYKPLHIADITYLIELAHLIRSLSGINRDELDSIKRMFRSNVQTDIFSVLFQLNSTDISKLFNVMKG